MKLSTRLAALAVLFAGGAGYAVAQINPPVATGLPMHQGDLVSIVPNGQPTTVGTFPQVGTLAGQNTYSYQIPLTGFTITPGNNITLLVLNPAGTLATGTITFAAAPSDGQRFCWLSTQTQTAVTMTANTGQSLSGTTVSAGVAGTEYCWVYLATTATWYHEVRG